MTYHSFFGFSLSLMPVGPRQVPYPPNLRSRLRTPVARMSTNPLKTATTTTVTTTTMVYVISSLRFGHATLRSSLRTSRRYLVNLAQAVGLPCTAATVFTSFSSNPSGFLCARYEFYRSCNTFSARCGPDRSCGSCSNDNSGYCIRSIPA